MAKNSLIDKNLAFFFVVIIKIIIEIFLKSKS